MKTLRVIFPLFTIFVIQSAFAQTELSGFLTSRDMLRDDVSSNLSLRNNSGTNATVFGAYVRQYAYVEPGQTCASATTIFTGNITAGSVVTPTMIGAGKGAAIGSNYLYNMILAAIYYEYIIIPSSPPGCALPGCTWGSDTTKYNWCIYLGALAPKSTTTGYTSSVPPAADAASGGGYDYNLVSSYVYLGPIACNDQTLTCEAASAQTQAFS